MNHTWEEGPAAASPATRHSQRGARRGSDQVQSAKWWGRIELPWAGDAGQEAGLGDNGANASDWAALLGPTWSSLGTAVASSLERDWDSQDGVEVAVFVSAGVGD